MRALGSLCSRGTAIRRGEPWRTESDDVHRDVGAQVRSVLRAAARGLQDSVLVIGMRVLGAVEARPLGVRRFAVAVVMVVLHVPECLVNGHGRGRHHRDAEKQHHATRN